jgi:hypothetical protein
VPHSLTTHSLAQVPDIAMKFAVRKTLGTVARVQSPFERSGKAVDGELRGALPLPPPLAELSVEQRQVVDKCRVLETETGDAKWEKLKSDLTFSQMWIKHVQAARGERSIAWGKGACVLDCPAATAVAWSMAFCGRDRMRISEEEGNPGERVRARKRKEGAGQVLSEHPAHPLHAQPGSWSREGPRTTTPWLR